jgi:hypothetical protein
VKGESFDSSFGQLLGRIYHRRGKTDLSAQEFKLTEALQRTDAKGSGSGPGTTRNQSVDSTRMKITFKNSSKNACQALK